MIKLFTVLPAFKAKVIIVLYLILFLPMTGTIFAQSHDDQMKSGNKLYQDGQFEQAIMIYGKILTDGFESPALYLNLGNSYFRTGKLGLAIYSYEKGLKLDPNDEDLIYNLKIANSRTFDKIIQLPKLFVISWWESLVTILSISGWALVLIIVFWILLGSAAVYYFTRNPKIQKLSYIGSSVSLAMLVLSGFLLFSRFDREKSTNYGILITPVYSSKLSPDIKSSDAFVIHEGIKFVIEDQVNDWVKIRLVDGKVGWIQKDSFKQI